MFPSAPSAGLPSTRTISAPRASPFSEAGELASMYPTRILLGVKRVTWRKRAPYPDETPDCDDASHRSVSSKKWNWSLGLPLAVVACVLSARK